MLEALAFDDVKQLAIAVEEVARMGARAPVSSKNLYSAYRECVSAKSMADRGMIDYSIFSANFDTLKSLLRR